MGRSSNDSNICTDKSPHHILKNMTPEEAFSDKKPNVENLRIFGCPVYSHIPKDKRNKLEPSGKKGIFVGYSDSSRPIEYIFQNKTRYKLVET